MSAHARIGVGKTRGRYLYNRADAMKLARETLRAHGYGPGSPRAAGWTRLEQYFAPTDLAA